MKKYFIGNVFVLALLFGLAPALARAGGGSNGGGGILYLILLPFFIAYSAYVSHRLRKKSQQCEELLSDVLSREKGWDIATIEGTTRSLFADIQTSWCAGDMDALGRLSKGPALDKLRSELRELKQKGHENRMDDLLVKEISLLNIQNFLDDEKDNFTVKIVASARDYTVDGTGKIVSANTRQKGNFEYPESVPVETFTEFWTLEREGEDWVLFELQEFSDWKKVVNRELLDEGTAHDSAYALHAGTGTPSLRPRWS